MSKLSKQSRYLILAAAAVMAVVYFLPIWYIYLSAPQYKDGLSMTIWLNNITGGTEFDLRNINLLNHYVGMKKISIESFPEFKFMPYVLLYMVAGAFIAFLINRLFMVYLGLINFVATAVAGMYDFWRWEYDYGHNLDPSAPMQMGVSFQPPLLFCKELLNFYACSWPHVGTIFLLVAGAILSYIVYREQKLKKSGVVV